MVQHLALKVDSMDTLQATKARLEAAGIEVVGPTDHTIFKSIYFFDPNGHRLELAADVGTPEMYAKLDEVKRAMLQEWSETRRAPAMPRGCTTAAWRSKAIRPREPHDPVERNP